MLGAVRRLQNQMGDLVVLVSEAEHFPEGYLVNLCVGIDGIQVHRGQSHVLMQACDDGNDLRNRNIGSSIIE